MGLRTNLKHPLEKACHSRSERLPNHTKKARLRNRPLRQLRQQQMALRWANESAAADVAEGEDAVARARPLRLDYHRRLLRNLRNLNRRDHPHRMRLRSNGLCRSGLMLNDHRRPSVWPTSLR